MQNPGHHEVNGERVLYYQGENPVLETGGVPAPAIGPTGYVMGRRYLPLAGLERGRDVSVCNVIRCRQGDPKTGRGTNSLPELTHGNTRNIIRHCQRAHWKEPEPGTVIVTQGEYALWAMTGEQQVNEWRGWVLPYRPQHEQGLTPRTTRIFTPEPSETVVLAHYHLAYLFREPWEEPTFIQDWRKVGWVVDRSWPSKLPPIERKPPINWPQVSGFDTEFRPYDRQLIRWSLAYANGEAGSSDGALSVHVVEHDWGQPRMVWPVRPTVYSHNWVADLPFLWWVHNVPAPPRKPLEFIDLQDTMYQHHVLYSDLAHTMDYVGSIYARINRWKHLEYINPVDYSGGDAVGALDVGLALSRSLQRDPQSNRVYSEYLLPNLPMLSRYELGRGYPLVKERVKASVAALKGVQAEAEVKAWAAAGWPIKLSSPQQVSHQIYKVEGV